MKSNLSKQKRASERGMTLLVTIFLMSILVAITASLLNVTLKQYLISGISEESEIAFHAADAGLLCAVYYDKSVTANGNSFDVEPPQGGPVTINCMGVGASSNGAALSGEEQRFTFDWGPGLCSIVSVYKFNELASADGDNIGPDVTIVPELNGRPTRRCPEDTECSVIVSRGYNRSCGPSLSGLRTVEREITHVY